MNCKLCSGGTPDAEARRREWGCDEPAAVPLLGATCWTCFGAGLEDCDTCKGDGMVDVDRCPFAVVEGNAWRICEYVSLLEVGILPVAGGLEDQAASFLEALRFTQGLKAELEAEELERQKRATRGH